MAVIHQRHLVRLQREVDVFIARELAANLAAKTGFDRYQTSEIETSISELGTNALKYGERGWASLRIDDKGFEAVVSDEGPGFKTAPKARSGLGVGLAGVKRLMDTMEIDSFPQGSRVRVRKELPRSAVNQGPSHWSIDVVTRARLGRSVSGDGFWAREADGSLSVAVIDGLGTGDGAAHASASVIESLESTDARVPIDEMLSAAHGRAVATRGAVCLLVRIDPSHQSVEYAGLGDVSGFLYPPAEHLGLSPGILGVGEPELRVSHLQWTHRSLLTMWSDGIALSSEAIMGGEATAQPGDWAETMALAHGVDRDDGLVLVAREGNAR